MISNAITLRFFVRLLAPLLWRRPEQKVRKLLEFAATESGSSLDMLRAAELETDPKLRRQFFRHATDEARHAELFSAIAKRLSEEALDDNTTVSLGHYAQLHARRQNLYERMGRKRFLAFVHLAERDGQAHFEALAKHFAASKRSEDKVLAQLFCEVERDERFHVAYSERALATVIAASENSQRQSAVRLRRVYWSVRFTRAKEGWRRVGRRIGDVVVRLLLATIYFICLPPFVAAQRFFDPERTGWVRPSARETLGAASTPEIHGGIASSEMVPTSGANDIDDLVASTLRKALS